MTNVIARFNPRATKRILYLAHWDTRPHADGPDSKDTLAPVPGANDGASGVAILLGVMDALHRQPPTIGVDLLFVDGEDYDAFDRPMSDVLIGATYYAKHPLPGPDPQFAVLFDMVGDKDLRIPIEPLFADRRAQRHRPDLERRRRSWDTGISSCVNSRERSPTTISPLIDAGHPGHRSRSTSPTRHGTRRKTRRTRSRRRASTRWATSRWR